MYGKETVELLRAKIKEVAQFFADKYNESIKEPVKFYDYYDKIGTTTKYVELTDKTFEVSKLEDWATFNDFNIEGMILQKPHWYKSKMFNLLEHFSIKAEYNYRGMWKTKNMHTSSLEYKIRQNYKVELTDELRGNVKEFLKEKLGHSKVFVGISHVKRNLNWYRGNILVGVPKEKWREYIKEWQSIENQLVRDFCNDYRGIEKTQEFIDWEIARKEWMKANRGTIPGKYNILNKQEGEVTIAYARKALIGADFVFEKKAIPIKDVGVTKAQIVVFAPEQVEQAKEFASMCVKQKAAIVGTREFTKIKDFKQIIRWDKFMEDNKPFRRIATAMLISKVLKKYDELIGLNNPIVTNCISALNTDEETLQAYLRTNYRSTGDTSLTLAIAETAKNLNLYDEEIMPILRRMEKAIETFSFITYLEKPRPWDTQKQEELSKIIHQMLLFRKKYYKELENYELVYVPPVVVEEKVLETV